MPNSWNKPVDWINAASASPAFAQRFNDFASSPALLLPLVDPAAQAFALATCLAHLRKHFPHRRTWIVAAQVRHQERLSQELHTWQIPHAFLPEKEQSLGDRALSDPEAAAERLRILHQLSDSKKPGEVVLITRASLDQEAPLAHSLSENAISLQVGQRLDLNKISQALSDAQFERVPQVISRGQFALRGGILDVFSWQSPHPLRLEFFDDELESLREFDVDSQASRGRKDQAKLVLSEPETKTSLRDWLSSDDALISFPECGIESHILIAEGALGDGEEDDATAFYGSPLGHFSAGDFVLQQARQQRFRQQLAEWRLQSWTIGIFFANKGEESRFRELMGDELFDKGELISLKGELAQGFTAPFAKIALLSSAEIFGRYQTPRSHQRSTLEESSRRIQAQTSIREIQVGDLVVHQDYGIGKFLAIEATAEGNEELHLEFHGGSKLSVPLEQAHLVAKYIGLGGKTPALSQLGDGKWAKLRKAAESSILDYAVRLVHTQAERESQSGFSHPPDTQWMWEFENSFHYKETPDQLNAIRDVKRDMESPKPMDRLICGDVGFGKTEVALRAAFKAVTSGKQVALLVPTTVLAEQHWRNFRERMSDYPFQIELLSRFRKPSEIKNAIHAIQSGGADIAIGTHRLISKDVQFKDLGLVIIDEEQRFGVKHKERFKQLFKGVDVLTLSATPIPRTLYLSLMGARDMSTIETPPPNRVPVATTVAAYDERLIKRAIERELERGGQVFFLHNRVQSIDRVKARLQELVPAARIVIGHGQMDKEDLEVVMQRFVAGEADVLLATTIIESGIDIPNANTILIDRADRFGLADLYQLRGRVGRGGHQAYAILLLPQGLITVGDARKRVNAIKQYSALGSGFRIAMRDLEIRGAGNLLGTQQSGHIAAVGFDLYCQMLKDSIDKLRGKSVRDRIEVTLRADFLSFNEAAFLRKSSTKDLLPAFLPTDFLPEPRLRIAAYKGLAEAKSLRDLTDLTHHWRDRFGRLPKAVETLLLCAKIKLTASEVGVASIEVKDQRLMLQRNGNFLQFEGSRFPRLRSTKSTDKLLEILELLQTLSPLSHK